jgi:hypothetical protein
VPESGSLGSGRGAAGNGRPYRETPDHASKTLDAAKTGGASLLRDKSAGNLITGRTAAGV